MFRLIKKFLSENKSEVETLPGFNTFFLKFCTLLAEIDENNINQNGNTTKGSKNKQNLKQELIDLFHKISQRLYAYAIVTENDTLQKQFKYKSSYFTNLAESKLVVECKLLYKRGVVLVDDLLPYKLTISDFELLNNLTEQFTEILPKPRENRSQSAKQSKLFANKIKEAIDVLNKIDKIINIITFDKPYFCSQYKHMRKIVKYGVRKLAFKLQITDNVTKSPIVNAIVYIENEEKNIKIRKKTALKGGFYIRNLPEGTYGLKIMKAGYLEKQLKINIVSGKMLKMQQELEKENLIPK